MNQSGLKALSQAKNISLAGLFLLMIGALVDLNHFPFQSILDVIFTLKSVPLFGALKAYSCIFLILFLFSKPDRKQVFIVITSAFFLSGVSSFFWPEGDLYHWQFTRIEDDVITFVTFATIPALIFLILRSFSIGLAKRNTNFDKNLLNLFILIWLLIGIPPTALELSISVQPAILDFIAMHWDAASNLNITPQLHHVVNQVPGLSKLVVLAYRFTPIGLMLVASKQLNGFPKSTASGAKTWVMLSASALIAYNFFPITGPQYIFGSEKFVEALHDYLRYPIHAISGSLAARNGMPSMHFGWMLASSILWWQSGSFWWSRALFIIATILTAIATIYLGEHYVVDLIVAIPFTLAVIAFCTDTVSWSHPEKRWTVIGGFLTWFIWILVLRHLVPFAEEHPWFCWVMNSCTAVVVVLQSIAISRFRLLAVLPMDDAVIESPASSPLFSTLDRKISTMFFASGAAALIYQVVFAKTLALTFGSTSTATLTVLATFLGGMAIGSYLGGRFAHRARRPIFVYAAIEGCIALYCIATPALFHATQIAYVALATGLPPEAPLLLLLRICLGGLVLLIPTILMGATLPLLVQILDIKAQRIGSKVALLYLTNTAGATIGALICGYALIPSIGITNTTLVAALLNFLVALGAIELNKRWLPHPAIAIPSIVSTNIHLPRYAMPLALFTLGVGGLLSLGLEVAYVHLLSIVAGNSVYAFSLMLATFLSGLSIGGLLFKFLMEKPQPEPLRWLAYAFIGLALSTSCSVYFWNAIPDYFASFATHPPARTFVAREAIRAVICALIMLPPTIFIGGAYVLGMDIVTLLARSNQVRTVGIGAAINTAGNILGVVLFGFCLLPEIGGIHAIHVISLTALLLSLLVITLSTTKSNKQSWIHVSIAGSIILACTTIPLNYQALSSGANVYFAPQAVGQIIDHAESIDGGLTSVTKSLKNNYKTLLTNGKFQGNNVWQGEMTAQIGFAVVPLMHQEKRDRALLIGYGTGVTSRVFKDAGFKDLDIAELSNDIVHMANKHFGEVNAQVTDQQHVHLHITDGRNMLLLASPEQRYDIISLEISSIWFAGAASLYNREFYQLAKAHLQPDGILQQWVQLHHLNPTDILSIISTARSEFKYISLYQLGGQGILIASNDPLRNNVNPTAVNLVRQTSPLVNLLAQANQTVEHVIDSRELDSQGIDRYLLSVGVDPMVWISDDNNLRLEYSTPKGNVNDSLTSYTNNMQLLRKFRSDAVR